MVDLDERRVEPVGGAVLVGGLARPFPSAVVVDHHVTAGADLRLEGLERQLHGLVPVATRVEDGDRPDTGAVAGSVSVKPALDDVKASGRREALERLRTLASDATSSPAQSCARSGSRTPAGGNPSNESKAQTSRLGAPVAIITDDPPLKQPQSTRSPGTRSQTRAA